MSTKDDTDAVFFEVGKDEQDPPQEWRVNVKCKSGLTEEEFAIALGSLSEDILEKRVDFETAPDIIDPDVH